MRTSTPLALLAALLLVASLAAGGCSPAGNEGNEGADMTGASNTPAPSPSGRPEGVGGGPQGRGTAGGPTPSGTATGTQAPATGGR